MKDRVGKELKLGDKVVATASHGYISLVVGEVTGFTPKKVRVSCTGSIVLRDSVQVAIIERNPAREAELSPKPVDANAVQDI